LTRGNDDSDAGVSIGVDVGGTFTDLCLVAQRRLYTAKVPTHPADILGSVLEGITKVLQTAAIPPARIRWLIHGTTIAINTLLERKGAVTGLLVSQGTRDVLEIARQDRPRTYDFFVERPAPLVPRQLRREVPERLDYQGHVLVPLKRAAVAEAVATLDRQGIQSLAICFLHSYRNDAHERQAEQIAREVAPQLLISRSSDIVPEFREYERMSTTVINAYVRPAMAGYLQELTAALQRRKIRVPAHLMRSDGGMMPSAAAAQRPVFLVESGAASGVAGAEYLSGLLRRKNLVSFDMGGTTAKACLIEGGKAARTTEYRVEGFYPITTPMLDVVEVGAGGGSIAWVDAGGALKVGPRSAGAEPGPACYGKGGEEPTVTDANLLLGRLNPAVHLAGELPLDGRAGRAVMGKLATTLGKEAEAAARGVLKVVEANMTNAIRLITVNRGRDPRDFTLCAFGGAGPMHAAFLAEELEMREVYVPAGAGTFSALGMLVAEMREELVHTELVPLTERALPVIVERVEQLVARAKASFADRRASAGQFIVRPSADLRYVGQSFEVNVPIDGEVSRLRVEKLKERFFETYGRLYSSYDQHEDLELVNVRCTLVIKRTQPRLPQRRRAKGIQNSVSAHRQVVFERRIRCPLYKAAALGAGAQLRGPAIVEADDSTIVVPQSWTGTADGFGGLLLRRA
jgi:N-methylhydantoinase A